MKKGAEGEKKKEKKNGCGLAEKRETEGKRGRERRVESMSKQSESRRELGDSEKAHRI